MTETTMAPAKLIAPIGAVTTSTDLKEIKKALTSLKIESKEEAIMLKKFLTVFGDTTMKALKKEVDGYLGRNMEGDTLELEGGLKITKVSKEVKNFIQKSERFQELEVELAQANQTVKYLKEQIKSEEIAPGTIPAHTQQFSYTKLV